MNKRLPGDSVIGKSDVVALEGSSYYQPFIRDQPFYLFSIGFNMLARVRAIFTSGFRGGVRPNYHIALVA